MQGLEVDVVELQVLAPVGHKSELQEIERNRKVGSSGTLSIKVIPVPYAPNFVRCNHRSSELSFPFGK